MSRIRIIGVGNPLMGDDGIGIAAVERLAGMNLPEGVEVVDGGTGGITLLPLMEGVATVILIDAVVLGRAPGSIVRFTPQEVIMHQGEGGLSLHEGGLAQVLALGRELETLPDVVVLYGVQPHSVERRLGLSPAMAQALGPLVEQVLAELPRTTAS